MFKIILTQENWIAAVKAADHLHSILLNPENVKKLEPAAVSFVQHMWALSDAVYITSFNFLLTRSLHYEVL